MLPDNNDELFYLMALTFVSEVGAKTGRALYGHFGSARAVFDASLKELKAVTGMGETRVKGFKDPRVFESTEAELKFAAKHGVQIISFKDDERYPRRLANCSDAPLLIYYRGNANLDAQKVVAIVGTRKHTDYGTRLTEELVEGLQSQKDILTISGLASGIDTIAHKKSLDSGIPTVGVLGHGLNKMYPAANKALAKEMILNGGLLTEFPTFAVADKGNFPMRNRVVAGLSDITVIVESAAAGGALITAHMANSYNREVAAYPGRVNDSRSAGCNDLIRTNMAAMITKADDLLDLMNWSKSKKEKTVQKQLFLNLSPEEQKIIDVLQTKDQVHADELFHISGLSNSQLAATLLQLEMQGLIKTLPGKNYRMN